MFGECVGREKSAGSQGTTRAPGAISFFCVSGVQTLIRQLPDRLEDIILYFPYIILFRISHYFHYCAPVNFYYACNYSKKNSRYNQTQSWNAKSSHSLCTSKGFNGCCTVATNDSGIAAITIVSLQYTCCKLIPVLQYGDDQSTLYYSSIIPA